MKQSAAVKRGNIPPCGTYYPGKIQVQSRLTQRQDDREMKKRSEVIRETCQHTLRRPRLLGMYKRYHATGGEYLPVKTLS